MNIKPFCILLFKILLSHAQNYPEVSPVPLPASYTTTPNVNAQTSLTNADVSPLQLQMNPKRTANVNRDTSETLPLPPNKPKKIK
jgi:hypothetical protein